LGKIKGSSTAQYKILNQKFVPKSFWIIFSYCEVVDFRIGVKLVDVVQQVSRRMLLIGVENHAAVRTLEDHLSERNQLKSF
jgi:hypothetical protein